MAKIAARENMAETDPLIQLNKVQTNVIQLRLYKKLYRMARFVSPEIMVFSFVFVFYYYQHYLRQYFIQWYAMEALESENISLPYEFICYNESLVNDLTGNNSTFDSVEARASHMYIIIMVATYAPSLVTNLAVSPLSDKYGRKPVMILALGGKTLAVMMCVITTYLKLDLYWFLVSAFLTGVSGGLYTILSVSFAYVSDISKEKWRTPHLGLVQAVLYISIAISSAVFNTWLQEDHCDFKPTLWLMVGIVLAGFSYSILMPDSISKQQRMSQQTLNNGFLITLFQGIKIFFWPRFNPNFWRLWLIALPIFIVVFGESGENSISTLFLLHKPLEWSRDLIGVYSVVRSAAHGIALFLLLPLLSWLRFPDIVIALIGIIVTVGTNIFLGFVAVTWEMYLAGFLQGIESLLVPALLGMNSKITEKEHQGALFSILSTVSLLGALCGSLVYSLVYPYTLSRKWPPGSSYWLMAIIWTVPVPILLLSWLCNKMKPKEGKSIN